MNGLEPHGDVHVGSYQVTERPNAVVHHLGVVLDDHGVQMPQARRNALPIGWCDGAVVEEVPRVVQLHLADGTHLCERRFHLTVHRPHRY